LARLDPLLRWLVIDGCGFHEGYFSWRRYIEECATPARLSGYARRVFDQGLGRSIWFVKGANVSAVAKAIDSFPASRRADLWSGTGLACAYAGGGGRDAVESLRAAAGAHLAAVAQGAAFAAKTRQRAANLSPHIETACRGLCRRSAEEAAAITDAALENLHEEGELPSYEVWRRRIQIEFAKEITRA
jgi:hypothetical protein